MLPPADISIDLPSPDARALERSHRLLNSICHEAAQQGGRLTFARYMELALYTPALGYYTGGLSKFGQQGDFITAPEISPLFARCLANQCQQIMQLLPTADILEFGAGSGKLAADMLLALDERQALPDNYNIIELSSELQTRQFEMLGSRAPHLLDRVSWLQSLPENFQGVVIANEVLDAMPVHRFMISDEGVVEMFVVCQDQQLDWQTGPLTPALRNAMPELPELAQNYRSEVNTRARAWIHSLADMLKAGVLLLIDYGYPRQEYYHPQRLSGTLQCHYQHRAHEDPLLYPGLQDITAHVDFTAVAEAGLQYGLDLLGFTNQASFLIGSGLESEAAQRHSDDAREQMLLAQEIRKLTLPGEMGEAFKVIALGRAVPEPLQGFQLNDQRWRLGLK